MRAHEIVKEWFIRRRTGDVMLLVSQHVQDQAYDRQIPWNQVERILDNIPNIPKEKLSQMLNFEKFYIRDDDTWTEVGCSLRTDGDVLGVYVNTVLRKEPGETRGKNRPVLTIRP